MGEGGVEGGGGGGGRGGGGGGGGLETIASGKVAMDQEYERRLLRQINHQNLPESQLAKVSDDKTCEGTGSNNSVSKD